LGSLVGGVDKVAKASFRAVCAGFFVGVAVVVIIVVVVVLVMVVIILDDFFVLISVVVVVVGVVMVAITNFAAALSSWLCWSLSLWLSL